MYDHDIFVLSLYLLEVLVLTYCTLTISTSGQSQECVQKVMSCLKAASNYPIIPWVLMVLPCCLAMQTMPKMDPLKRIPELTHTNFKEWRFQILLAFKTAGVVCHGLYKLCSKKQQSGGGATSSKLSNTGKEKPGDDATSSTPSNIKEEEKLTESGDLSEAQREYSTVSACWRERSHPSC
jgi:hypothetical protein